MKSLKFQKFKVKYVGFIRGFVYGLVRGEIELSVNGKRLRIERESVGRFGGVFVGDGE